MTKEELVRYLDQIPDTAEIHLTVTEKQNYNEFINSSLVEELGVSKQLLHYWVKQGYVRTVARGKQYRYSKADILKMKK